MSLETSPKGKFRIAAEALVATQERARQAEIQRKQEEYDEAHPVETEQRKEIDRLMENGVLTLFVDIAREIHLIYPDVEVRLSIPDGREERTLFNFLGDDTVGIALAFGFERTLGRTSYVRIAASDYFEKGFQLEYGSERQDERHRIEMEPVDGSPAINAAKFEYSPDGIKEAAEVISDLIGSGEVGFKSTRAISYDPRDMLDRATKILHPEFYPRTPKDKPYLVVPLK